MPTIEMPTVAKKKAVSSNPGQWKAKPIIVQIRGSLEYKGWVERLAEFDATTVADVVERSLAAYARQIGFVESRPKR